MLDIGTVAQRTGVPPSTLRYYEDNGLIQSVGRKGLRRQFDPQVLMQLALIDLMKMAGFRLGEIRGVFGMDGRPALSRPALHARADEIEQQIRELTTLKKALRHVAECPAQTHLACPKFRRILRMTAGHKAAHARD